MQEMKEEARCGIDSTRVGDIEVQMHGKTNALKASLSLALSRQIERGNERAKGEAEAEAAKVPVFTGNRAQRRRKEKAHRLAEKHKVHS